jgi:Na+/proline symporter/nitrogen-specific signal transduction histidine kinase
MTGFSIGILSILYVAFLFLLAFLAERFSKNNKSLIDSPWIYALSLSVYCTAWTFYGSVGRAYTHGIEFLAVYIGPSLMMFLGWHILRKMIRISKVYSINSISDFISARYGKFRSLGVAVTFISLMAGIPYIGLQIKAISGSFETITGIRRETIFYQDATFYIVLMLIAFTLLFGTRKIEKNETHEGMVFAISIESILKLIAFLIVGVYVTYYLNNGFVGVFEAHFNNETILKAFDFEKSVGYGNWFFHILVSGFAFLFLPRQFQVAVVEINNEKNLKQAIWLFPLYLLIINLFVIPIALTGHSYFFSSAISPDNYMIAIPLVNNANWIALVAYIGGFSAATGMIIVETIAISTMVTNSIILPFLLENRKFKEKYTFNILNFAVWLRRLVIIFIVLLGYSYFNLISDLFSLVSIGLIAFVAISQFAPSLLGGLFWKKGNQKGALCGLIAGSIIWFFTLVLPPILQSANLINQGSMMYYFYDFFKIFSIAGFDEISNSSFWSILINALIYWSVSRNTLSSAIEIKQALLFVDVLQFDQEKQQWSTWKGKAKNFQLKKLMMSFLGKDKTEKAWQIFGENIKVDLNASDSDPRVVSWVENVLGGIVGTATARILVSSISKEENIGMEEMMEVLEQTQKVIEDNEELKLKKEQLQKLSDELKMANQNLLKLDLEKNEFLSTVTHEIRTPLTSIKALSEIIQDNDDLEEEQRKVFLTTIISETDRLSRLVNQVLDLEKYESGKHVLMFNELKVLDLVGKLQRRFVQLTKDKNILLDFELEKDSLTVFADEDKIMQVLINLISNAFKFVNENEGRVLVKIGQRNDYIYFSIIDNGLGIELDLQSKIFEKFFQIENNISNLNKGSGLGLSIAKKIVELHNGYIHLESEINKGSVFTVHLPTIK